MNGEHAGATPMGEAGAFRLPQTEPLEEMGDACLGCRGLRPPTRGDRIARQPLDRRVVAVCPHHATYHAHAIESEVPCWAAIYVRETSDLVCQITGAVFCASMCVGTDKMTTERARKHEPEHAHFLPPLEAPRAQPEPPKEASESKPPSSATMASKSRAVMRKVEEVIRGALFPTTRSPSVPGIHRAARAHEDMVRQCARHARAPHVPALAIVARYLARTSDGLDVGTECHMGRVEYYAERARALIEAHAWLEERSNGVADVSKPSAANIAMGMLGIMRGGGLRRVMPWGEEVMHPLPPDAWLTRLNGLPRVDKSKRNFVAGLVDKLVDEARGQDVHRSKRAVSILKALCGMRQWHDADSAAMVARGRVSDLWPCPR